MKSVQKNVKFAYRLNQLKVICLLSKMLTLLRSELLILLKYLSSTQHTEFNSHIIRIKSKMKQSFSIQKHPLPSSIQIYTKNQSVLIENHNYRLTIVFKLFNDHLKYTTVLQKNAPNIQQYENLSQLYQALYKCSVIHEKTPQEYITIQNHQIILKLPTQNNQIVQTILSTDKEVMYSEQLAQEIERLSIRSSFYQQQIQKLGTVLQQKSNTLAEILKNKLEARFKDIVQLLVQRMEATYKLHEQKLNQIVKTKLQEFGVRCDKNLQNLLDNNAKISLQYLLRENKQNEQINLLFENEKILNDRIAVQSSNIKYLKFTIQEFIEQIKLDYVQKVEMDKVIEGIYDRLQSFKNHTQAKYLQQNDFIEAGSPTNSQNQTFRENKQQVKQQTVCSIHQKQTQQVIIQKKNARNKPTTY